MAPVAVVTREEFERTLERVERLLQRIDSEAQSLVGRCERALDLLPDFMTAGLRESLTEFLEILAGLFRVVGQLIGSPGWPPGLYEAGTRWTEEVGARASALASLAGAEMTNVDERWQGPAAEAYTQALTAQANALRAIKAASDEIDNALSSMCWALLAFWAAVVGVIMLYLLELRAAAGVAATVVGAGPAAGAAIASTIRTVSAVTAIVGALVIFGEVTTNQYKALNQRLHDSEGLPGGAWPPIDPASMSDARVTDGDGTDWRLKY